MTPEQLNRMKFADILKTRFHTAELYHQGILVGGKEIDQFKPQSLKNLALLIGKELDGGTCDQCGKPWREVRFTDNRGRKDGRYFIPGCHCHHVCPICGTFLYEEELRGDLARNHFHCTQCGWALYEFDQYGKRTHKRCGPGLPSHFQPDIIKARVDYLSVRYDRYIAKITDPRKVWMVNGIPVDPPLDHCPTMVSAV